MLAKKFIQIGIFLCKRILNLQMRVCAKYVGYLSPGDISTILYVSRKSDAKY